MGITGLLPLLKSIAQPVHISVYKGEKVAIDGFAWLHRGAHNCASELALQQPTDRHIKFCLSRIRLLIENGVKPVLVFDGRRMPMKGDTDGERADKRRQERAMGMQLHRSGQHEAANKCFQRAVSITASAAKAVQIACQMEFPQVECLWAPYEADAQLAYLTKINYVKAVISEDSDLLVFGTSSVIFKLDAQGNGSEIKVNNLALCTELALSSLTHHQFQQIAVLSGCDYVNSLSGMGMKKAHALIRTYKSWERAVRKVKLEGKTRVHQGYEESVERALLCFKHQTVFDPVTKQQTSLHPIEEDVRARFADLDFLGPFLEPEVAVKMSRGEISPETLEPYGNDTLVLHRSRSIVDVSAAVAAQSSTDNVRILPPDLTGFGSRLAPAQRVASMPSHSAATKNLRANTKLSAYFVSSSNAASKPFVAPRPKSSQEDSEPESHSSPSRTSAKRSAEDAADSEPKRIRNATTELSSPYRYLPPEITHFAAVETLESVTFQSVHQSMMADKENVACSDQESEEVETPETRPLSCNRERRFTVEHRAASLDLKRATSVVDRVFDSLKPRALTASIFDQFRFRTRTPSPTLDNSR